MANPLNNKAILATLQNVPSNAGKLVGKMKPALWLECKTYITSSGAQPNFTVPENVYQLYAMVFGGGGAGNTAYAGSGGGFASGIIDVVPGQTLPTITVGSAGGTSSIGTWLSATGGANNAAGGTGSAASFIRNMVTYSGGTSVALAGGGASSGNPYGNGYAASVVNKGGSGWGGTSSDSGGSSAYFAATSVTGAGAGTASATGMGISCPSGQSGIATYHPNGFDGGGSGSYTDIANKSLNGSGGGSSGGAGGIGGGGGGGGSSGGAGGIGGGGGYGGSSGGAGGIGGGGGSGGSSGGAGGIGGVMLFWTTGY